MARPGADLALLFLGSFRQLVDAAVLELAARGFEDVRPVHDFVMRAIDSGADTAAELGRRMAVTKQAAGQTVSVLVERGYVARQQDPHDARRTQLKVTALGMELMREGEAIFDDLRLRLEAELGVEELSVLEGQLRVIVGGAPVRLEAPGWVAKGL